jgi:hypothetical protein
MASDYLRMASTAGQAYAAALAATAETGARALRAAAQDSAQVAEDAAAALRAPQEERASAIETAARSAFESQRRQLHMMRGLATLWSMAFLRGMDAARERQHPEQ